jgi:hypothetical protein
MAQSSRFGLPFLQPGQAQKEITHNDAIAQVDCLLHLAVESRHAANGTGMAGTAWIVPANSTGPWAGHDGAIAIFDESGSAFVMPPDGCVAFVRDESVFIHYAAGQWRDAWPVLALAVGGAAAIANPSGGGVIDVEARAALGALLVALCSAGLVAST